MSKYGITITEYDALYQHQDGVCAICGKPESGRDNTGTKIKALAVDHDHETGAIRGLLCSTCNSFLGYIGEDPEILRRGAEYIERTKKQYNLTDV
jgi:Autographiviridae endonuclease VII